MQDAVKNLVFPPALSDLEIRGPIAEQMDTFLYERVFSDFYLCSQRIYAISVYLWAKTSLRFWRCPLR